MSGLRRALGLVAIEGVVVGLVALAIVLSSDHIDARGAVDRRSACSSAGRGSAPGCSPGGGGPDNRFGVLMTAVGFAFFLGVLAAADDRVVFTIGVLLSAVYFAVFVHMLVAYPDGRLERRGSAAARGRLRARGPRPAAGAAVRRPRAARLRGCPQSVLFIERQRDALHDLRRLSR